MCKYRVLKTMKSNGTLKAALYNGVVSPNVVANMKVYEYYLNIKSQYDKKRTAITVVSDDMKICERTVYNILKDFGC